MLKNNRKTLIIASIVTVLPVLAGLILWNRLPDVMATHFGMNNEANGFSSKAFAVFGIPLFLLVIEWVGAVATANDPRKQNISPKMFTLVLWIAPVVSIIVAAAIYPYNLGIRTDMSLFAGLFTGVLFIIVGNYLPKARQNYTIGIKLPWTLADEDNWNRTHRLAGYLWAAAGIALVVLSLIGVRRAEWMLGILFAAVLVPTLYSFFLHMRKDR